MVSHVLGYTGVISDSELSRAGSTYDPQDFIGKSGVELEYESYLRGLNGSRQVEVDAAGRVVKLLGDVEPEPGNVVQLNVDMELQKTLYEQFQKAAPNVKGAAVALDPRTGQVLALLSLPGFNSNLFAPGISSADYQKLLTDSNLPLFNRAIAGTYPPGSVIKPVGAVAGLEEGTITENTVIVDRGSLNIPNQYNPNISYQFRGWKLSGLGPMTVRSAIAESSDIFYYVLAGGHPSSPVAGLGAEKLADYYRKFALGRLTGIDLDGEKAGRVADPNWKATRYASDPISAKWYLGDTYHISIGQGDMLATPLQVALWTSAIANGGTVYKPQVVHQVLGQNGQVLLDNKPSVLIQNSFKPETMRVVQEGMRENVTSDSGSGRTLRSLPITSAGKTGTSQFDGSDPSRTHAWYTAYAPYENPEITIAVLVEAGGEGHAVAVPVVRETLRWWAEHRYNKK
jgi:penicillin-binding protein 2